VCGGIGWAWRAIWREKGWEGVILGRGVEGVHSLRKVSVVSGLESTWKSLAREEEVRSKVKLGSLGCHKMAMGNGTRWLIYGL
jgi:hypothetical protein